MGTELHLGTHTKLYSIITGDWDWIETICDEDEFYKNYLITHVWSK